MTGWVVLATTLAACAAYLRVGLGVARARRPRAWAAARRSWSMDDSIASSARWMTFWAFLLWPLFVAHDWFVPRLTAFAEAGDPVELEARARKLERHIRDLEQENGLPPMDLS